MMDQHQSTNASQVKKKVLLWTSKNTKDYISKVTSYIMKFFSFIIMTCKADYITYGSILYHSTVIRMTALMIKYWIYSKSKISTFNIIHMLAFNLYVKHLKFQLNSICNKTNLIPCQMKHLIFCIILRAASLVVNLDFCIWVLKAGQEKEERKKKKKK